MASLNRLCSVVIVPFLMVAVPVLAQDHKVHEAGMTHRGETRDLPIETGQSAFEAIAEIVVILDTDEFTDWSSVSIDALRAHLVDMDRLMLNSIAESKVLDDQRIEFQVRAKEQALSAVHGMVPAHAQMVSELTGWQISIIRETTGAVVTVETDSPDALIRLKGLGFYGFMTIGAHHQAHHLKMAKGLGH